MSGLMSGLNRLHLTVFVLNHLVVAVKEDSEQLLPCACSNYVGRRVEKASTAGVDAHQTKQSGQDAQNRLHIHEQQGCSVHSLACLICAGC
eukprot:1097195-Pelagomonas_calceolata.AAC.1